MSCFYRYIFNDSDPGLDLDKYYCSDDIIIFILLIAGVCVGLPALVWAIYVVHNYRKKGGGISAFIILLLFNDLLELLLSLFIASYLFFDDSETFSLWPELGYQSHYENVYTEYVVLLWTTFNIDGLYLHQLVALESILSLKSQTCSAQVFSPPCSIILCIVLSLVVFGCQFVFFLNVALCLFAFCILGVTCLLAYKVPDRVPHKGMNPRSAVLIVSTVTVLAFCAAFIIVLIVVIETHMDIYNYMFAFLVSVRVFSDPLLCVLVCKEKLRDQKQQTDAELHTDLQSVLAVQLLLKQNKTS